MRRTFLLIFCLFSLTPQVWAVKTAEQLTKEIEDIKRGGGNLGQTLGQAQQLLKNTANGIDGVIQELKNRGVREEEIQKVVAVIGVDPRNIANNIRGIAGEVPTGYDGFKRFREKLQNEVNTLNNSKVTIEREADKERGELARIDGEIKEVEEGKRYREAMYKKHSDIIQDLYDRCTKNTHNNYIDQGACCAALPLATPLHGAFMGVYKAGIEIDNANLAIKRVFRLYPQAVVDLNNLKTEPYRAGILLLEQQIKAMDDATRDIDRQIEQKKKDYLCKDRDRGATGGGLIGEYFNNKNLSGAPQMIKKESFLGLMQDWKTENVKANNWEYSVDPVTGSDTVECGMNADNWSARWQYKMNSNGGVYKFTTTADDGVRLWVNGIKIIDDWRDHPPTTNTATVPLAEGEVPIKVEFYDSTQGAMINFKMESLSGCAAVRSGYIPMDHWKGEYFNNMNVQGAPSMIKDDGAAFLNFDWGNNSPNSACLLPVDNWSTRWTRRAAFENKTYRFKVTTDDGMRLYVDGVLKINQWRIQAPTEYFADIPMTAGYHTIKVEYYDGGYGATAKVAWALAPNCQATVPEDHWKGEYFNNVTLSGTPVLTRDDGGGALNFDWQMGSPNTECRVNADNWSTRWTRTASFENKTYVFQATTDDGMRVTIDGVQKINEWRIQAPTAYSVNVPMTAGNHTIKVEYYDGGWGATAKLDWRAIATPTPPPTPPPAVTPSPPAPPPVAAPAPSPVRPPVAPAPRPPRRGRGDITAGSAEGFAPLPPPPPPSEMQNSGTSPTKLSPEPSPTKLPQEEPTPVKLSPPEEETSPQCKNGTWSPTFKRCIEDQVQEEAPPPDCGSGAHWSPTLKSCQQD